MERIIDDKTRDELLGYLPFDSDTSIPIVIEIPNSDFRPTFFVRALKQSEVTQISSNNSSIVLLDQKVKTREALVNTKKLDLIKIIDEAYEEQELKVSKINEDNLEIIRGCITNVKNLYLLGSGKEIKEIEYKKDKNGGLDLEIWLKLPKEYKYTISHTVRKISGLQSFEYLGLK